MKVYTLVLLCASSLVSTNALAQWQWLDAQGRKVFSDLPPSNQVPADRILQRPTNVRPAAIPAPSGTATPVTPAAPAPGGRGIDQELQARKTAEETEQARRDQALAQQQDRLLALQRQDNCARARITLATLVDGKLVAHTNAQGDRAYMDDNARAIERQRAQGIIASDCAPGAASAAPRTAPTSMTQPGGAQPAAAPPNAAQAGVTSPGSVSPGMATQPAASRRDPTPPDLARPGATRPGRPDEPAPPTIQ